MPGFTERLEEIVKAKGLTSLRQLSLETGIPYSTITNWHVRGSLPDAKTLLDLRTFLNVSIDFLLTGDQPKQLKRCYINDAEIAPGHPAYKLAEVALSLPKNKMQSLLSIAEIFAGIERGT